jgi:hypothetical protein
MLVFFAGLGAGGDRIYLGREIPVSIWALCRLSRPADTESVDFDLVLVVLFKQSPKLHANFLETG